MWEGSSCFSHFTYVFSIYYLNIERDVFFIDFDRLSSLESLFYLLSGCWFQWHFWLKLKSQNTKEPAHLFLSCKDEIYSVQCKNNWQATYVVLNFQNTFRLYFLLENVLAQLTMCSFFYNCTLKMHKFLLQWSNMFLWHCHLYWSIYWFFFGYKFQRNYFIYFVGILITSWLCHILFKKFKCIISSQLSFVASILRIFCFSGLVP